MGPDFSANGFSFDLDTDEFDLESILSEYKDYDPAAPAATPRAKAAFPSRPIAAELIDEPDVPEEPLGVLEQALAAPDPEPEPEPVPAPPAPETNDPFASYDEDYPDADVKIAAPKGRSGLLRGTWRETLGLPEQDEPDEDVREYHPGELHARRTARSSAAPARDDGVRGQLRRVRDWVDRVTAEFDRDRAGDDDAPAPAPERRPRTAPARSAEDEYEPTMVFRAVTDEELYAPRSGESYAAEAEREREETPPPPPRPDFRETVLQPLLTRIAAVAYRVRESQAQAREDATAEEPLGPELSPERAAKYYGGRTRSLKLRGRISAIVTLLLLYISLGLPTFGLLRSNEIVRALVCLILLMTSMLAGLDVLVTGVMSLLRRRPGLETMVALSAIFSLIDAVVCAILGSLEFGLPFCGVSALAITLSLYSALYTCQGLRKTFRVLQKAEDPLTIFADPNLSKEGLTLLKSSRPTDGFIHRAEESSPGEAVYTVLSPYLIVLGIVLSLLAAILNGRFDSIAHILSAVFAAFVPVSVILSFSLPFRTVAQRLFSRGIAIAGWSGTSDIGRSAHIIVTDDDIFPPKTVQVGDIRILEGAYPQKVISAAASVVIASGSCLAPVFAQLLEKHHCRLIPVDQFSCGKTGGLTAVVDGEEVMVGGADFVNLRGIRLSEKLTKKDTLFVVISGQLVGIIHINYTPVKSVQNALMELLRSKQAASFAVRDSNITPVMLHQKFKISTDGFHFPSYAKRYAMSAAEPSEETHIAGVMARRGLGSFVRISSMGKRLYGAVRTLVVLSVIAAVLGVLAMFLLLAMGAFDAATVSNLVLYQLLWLIPLVVTNLGLKR
ncbi:MAG: hypothetical protein IJ112_05125 [Oscillospiraceae bacterium]|nr:hypothetical protein [Oscillospiraceae bacterium]